MSTRRILSCLAHGPILSKMKRNCSVDLIQRSKIPLSLSIMNNIEGWQMMTTLRDVSDDAFQIIMVEFTIYRGPTQRFFSLFIASVMWLLSFSLFWLAFTLCIRKRKVEPPTLGVGTSMLFALPAIRNVQPGSPPIGCTADYLGFFWALLLVAAGAMILLLNYIKMYKADPNTESKEVLIDDSELIEAKEDTSDPVKDIEMDIEMNVSLLS
jgi:hypothetical protein